LFYYASIDAAVQVRVGNHLQNVTKRYQRGRFEVALSQHAILVEPSTEKSFSTFAWGRELPKRTDMGDLTSLHVFGALLCTDLALREIS
jgi:hypothetical protein